MTDQGQRGAKRERTAKEATAAKTGRGGREGGARPKHGHRNNPHKKGDREPGGSRGQRESGQKGPDSVLRCLSRRPKGGLEHQR